MASSGRGPRLLTRCLLALIVLAQAWVVGGRAVFAQARAPGDCSLCHDLAPKLQQSAHARLNCGKCHLKHETYPHPEGIPKPDCASCHPTQTGAFAASVHGMEKLRGNAAAPDCAGCHGGPHELKPAHTADFRKATPDTCGMCHGEIVAKYQTSVHGQAVQRGVLESAVCTDCHGEHAIQRPEERTSEVSGLRIRETCGHCHGDLRLARRFGLPADRLTSFDASFHGLTARVGSQRVANCSSCHGYHEILPSSDPRSMIHPRNLGKTCGHCHPGAGSRFILGQVHLAADERDPFPVLVVRGIYLVVIPLTIGLMLLHHAGDWVRKLWRLRLSGVALQLSPTSQPEVRMHRWERIQHAILVISFFVLVWTGFALKYPDQFWAKPLLAWESQWPVRGWIHRAAGVVLIALSVAHVVSLVVNRGLRKHWLELIPRRNDVTEGIQMLAYNLGFWREKPAVSPHGYIEKAEYWAVVWGTAVMAITGLLLWFTNLVLARFSKVWLDVATTVHFYEAVLASLSIVIWHFYVVIYDPEVYPMDTSWLTGKSVRWREQLPSAAPPANSGGGPAAAD